MATNETLPNEHSLVLERKDLREIYTKLETEEDWHRLAQRVYMLNKTFGKKTGVRFILHRERAVLRVYFSAAEKLAAVLASLREGRGFVQKALAEALERKAGEPTDRRSIPKRLRDGQSAMLRETLARDLGLFSSVDIDSVLVDVAAPGSTLSLTAQTAGLLPGGALVLGESGSGKTALLYSLLRHWESFGALAGHTPVYVSAKHLHFAWGSFTIPWAALPGVSADMVERLEAAFEEGRLALLIDGVNENPGCTDFTNPGVQSFWKTAGRNAVVIASSPRFYESHIKVSPLRAIFAGGLGQVALPCWGAALYRGLFERLAAALRKNNTAQIGLLAGCLDKLSVEDWQRTSQLLRLTPLTGLACANFFVSRQGERLPKDEYELMEHMTSYHLRHEGFKGNVPAASDTVLGLLMRLAWQAYVEGQGGKFSCISTDNAARIIREHYPALEERKAEVFHFLSQLPYLEYSPENGLFYMNQHFADYLVARYILQTFLSGDTRRLKEVMGIHWEYLYVSRYYFQGLQGLAKPQMQQFVHVTQGLADSYRHEGAGTGDFSNELVLARLLQPLGFLDVPEAKDFLWSVFHDSQDGPELTLMSSAIGLAWGGDAGALEAYVERLRKTPKAAQFNLRWYLFYKRHDRFRRDIENFGPEAVGRWEAVCDWLLGAMLRPERDFLPLRLLYSFSLCNFLKAMGPGPFAARKAPAGGGVSPENGGGQAQAAERVKLAGKVVAAWSREAQVRTWPALQKQFVEMSALLAKHKIVSSKNGGK